MASDTTIRVALLGCDREVLRLVRAVRQQGRLRVVAGHCVGRYAAVLHALLPDISLHDDWEPLLADARVDVTLVAHDQQERWRPEALRRLTRAGRVLWLVHPACRYLLAIELDVLSQTHGGKLVPYCPALAAPALHRLRALLAAWHASEGEPPDVELELTTPVFARSSSESIALRARDVSLLQYVVGPSTRVTALQHSADSSASVWTVTIDTEGGIRVHWSAAATQGQRHTELRARCGQRSACLQVAHNDRWVRLVTTPEQDESLADATPRDGPSRAIADLCAILSGREADQGTSTSWSRLCDDLEVLDAVERSRRDRQTVTLRERSRRPERQFQQRMAVASCLLLSACLLVLVTGTLREVFLTAPRSASPVRNATGALAETASVSKAARDQPRPLWQRLWPVYPLVLFLLCQCWRTRSSARAAIR